MSSAPQPPSAAPLRGNRFGALHTGPEDEADRRLTAEQVQGEVPVPVDLDWQDRASQADDDEVFDLRAVQHEDDEIGLDDEGQLGRILRGNQRFVKNTEFPNDWKNKEPGYVGDYRMEYGELFTNRYFANDRPHPKEFQHGSINNMQLNSSHWACVYFPTGDHRYSTLRSVKAAQSEGVAVPFVKVGFRTDTQRPSIRLQITRVGGADITVHIFGDNIRRDAESDEDQYFWMNSQGTNLRFPQDWKELKIANDKRSLFEIEIGLWHHNELAPEWTTPASRPVFDGISIRELAAIAALAPTKDSPITQLTPADELIALLWQGSHIKIFFSWPDGGTEAFRKFKDWMTTAFAQVGAYGNNWFYRLQEERDGPSVLSPEFNLKNLAMPRWTATKFSILEDDDGRALQAPKPVRVKSFAFTPGDTCFPNAADQALEYRIAIERNREFQSHILESSFKQQGFLIQANFKQHPRQPNVYIVSLRAHENSLLAKDKSLRPCVDSKIRIEALKVFVNDDGFVENDETAAPDVFNGVISADLFESGAEVVCCVTGPTLDVQQSDIRWVSAVLKDDATPSNRWKAAIEQISLGIQPQPNQGLRGGVDIPHAVLSAPPSIGETDSLAKEFAGVKTAVSADLQRLRLSQEQMAGVMNSLESLNGFTLVQGPPGCGKSQVGVAAAKAHIDTGKKLPKARRRPVLACAPSNIAVDTALDKFFEATDGGQGYEIVRYRGSFLHEKKRKADVEMADAADTSGGADDLPGEDELAADMRAAIWELADEKTPFGHDDPHEEFSFHRKRHAAATRWSQHDGHVMHDDAVEFLDVTQRLKATRISKDERRELRDRLEVVAESVSQYYFDHEVDIVFATNSSSAHGILREFFRPKFLLSDEAAVTTLPDAATPMAAFIDSIEGILMCGDIEQQKPVVLSKGSNEFFDTLDASMFSLLFKSKRFAGAIVALRVQHRMHPDISAAISKLFYKGELVDHPSVVSRVSTKYTTLAHMLEALKPAWNGRRRLVIDVSGDGVESKRYQGGTSWYNEREARVTVDFIKAAVAYTPPPSGAPIVASDFLILTPYTGMAELVRGMLLKERINTPGNKARVASIRAIQGEQAPFVLVAMTRNMKGKPLSIGLGSDANSLNVAMSRAEEMLVVLGNLRGWCQAHEDGARLLFNNNGKMRTFGRVIDDFIEKGDIVSGGDLLRREAGQQITAPEFPTLIEKGRGKGSKRPVNSMNSRSLREPYEPEDESSRVDRFGDLEKKNKKKARRSNVKKANRGGRGGGGGRGGRGGRGGGDSGMAVS